MLIPIQRIRQWIFRIFMLRRARLFFIHSAFHNIFKVLFSCSSNTLQRYRFWISLPQKRSARCPALYYLSRRRFEFSTKNIIFIPLYSLYYGLIDFITRANVAVHIRTKNKRKSSRVQVITHENAVCHCTCIIYIELGC